MSNTATQALETLIAEYKEMALMEAEDGEPSASEKLELATRARQELAALTQLIGFMAQG